jgi:hypothetical protein
MLHRLPCLLRTPGLTAASLLLASLAAACGDSAAGGNVNPDDIGDDAGTRPPSPTLPDAGAGPDATPDADELPPDIARLTVAVDPQRQFYLTGFRLLPMASVFNAAGDLLPDEAVTWTFSPEAAVTARGPRWEIVEDGPLTVTGCADRLPTVCGSLTLQVDDGPPTLQILRPLPGEELSALDGPVIEVEGIATDASRTPSVFVNGVAAPLDAEGRFTAEIRPRFGINHIEAVATDGVQDEPARAALDVMWGVDYLPGGVALDSEDPNDKRTAVTLLDAVQLRVNQNFVDDGQRIGAPDAEGRLSAGDLADIFQLILAGFDIQGLLPNPIIDSDIVSLGFLSASLGDPRIAVDITDRGLEVFLDFPNVFLETTGRFEFGSESVPLDGSLSLNLAAVLDLALNKPDRDAPLDVEVTDFQVALIRLSPNFESEEVNALFEFLEAVLFGSLENLIATQLGDALLGQIPMLVEDLLGSIDNLLGGEPFVLDTGFLPTIALGLQTRVATIRAVRRSHLAFSIDLSVETDTAPAFPATRGVALSVPFTTPAGYFSASRLQVGLRESLVNGLLHTLWNGGLLQGDVTSVLPDAVSILIDSVEIDARLPPVLSAAEPEESDLPFLISVGQFELTLGRGIQQDRIGLLLRIGADIQLDGSSLSVTLSPQPQVTVWLLETNGEEPIFNPISSLETLVLNVVWPLATEGLAGGLAFELPELSGALFADLSPSLADLSLRIDIDRPLIIRNGYIILDGGVTALLPVGP